MAVPAPGVAELRGILELDSFDQARRLRDALKPFNRSALRSEAGFRGFAREKGLGKLLALKGFGSGLESFAGAADVAKGSDTLLWDGDWFKEDSFTSFIAEFLRASPSHHAVAFRKASGKLDGFLQSWSRAGLLDRIFLVLVSDGCVEGARAELRGLGVPTADLENLCLGWLSTRVTGAERVLALGGGPTVLAEAQTALRLPHAAERPRPRWEVLPLWRVREGAREEVSAELLELSHKLCER
ncbi:unnamed protein product [Symbiodinium sp. CCMP2592]|nr:unnamed protein product [Symbiodinium sp. CCMP2592]